LFYTFRNHNIKEQTGVNDQSLASWGKTQRGSLSGLSLVLAYDMVRNQSLINRAFLLAQ
jgi:hypothetical protein